VEVALEEAKFAEETEDTTFVDTFKRGTAALEKDAGIPTISPTRTSRICRTLSEKKTHNSSKPELNIMHGRDSSSLRRHKMMFGQSPTYRPQIPRGEFLMRLIKILQRLSSPPIPILILGFESELQAMNTNFRRPSSANNPHISQLHLRENFRKEKSSQLHVTLRDGEEIAGLVNVKWPPPGKARYVDGGGS